jgi:hypothetical protein
MTDVFSVATTIKYRAQAGTWPPEKRSAIHCTSPRFLPSYTERRSDISNAPARREEGHEPQIHWLDWTASDICY